MDHATVITNNLLVIHYYNVRLLKSIDCLGTIFVVKKIIDMESKSRGMGKACLASMEPYCIEPILAGAWARLIEIFAFWSIIHLVGDGW